ncbi:F-box/LRR-repeat protein 20 [Anabrus simplex]|uniref:F-box/LRR-repeat protein 20 n=1 Tax=Anabrus simplex TaxID=316456 RepID=UPI0035A31681
MMETLTMATIDEEIRSSDEAQNFTAVLPEELLVEIFSYLSFEDLINSVQFVSSHWREVSYDPHLWRERVYYPKQQDTDKQIIEILKKTPKLRIFIADQRPVHSSVLYTLIDNCSDLRTLILCRHQKLSFRLIKKLVQQCPNIEQLFLPNRILNEAKLAQAIGQFSKLRNLSGVVLVDPRTSAFLKPIADGCPNLQHVDLTSMVCTFSDLSYLLYKKREKLHTLGLKLFSKEGKCTLPLLAHCQALKTLHLDSYGSLMVDVGFDSLQNLSTLTTLCLQYLEGTDLNIILKLFENMAMSQLIELSIMYYENYEDRLADVIITNCPRLRRFQLVQCTNLSDQSLENFCHLRDLQSVHLDTTDITSIGIEYLSNCRELRTLALVCCEKLQESSMALMVNFENLQELTLDYCNIKGLPLDLIPSKLKHLQLLSIRCCLNKDREAVKQLLKEMPHLIVTDGMNECEQEMIGFRHEMSGDSNLGFMIEDAPYFYEILN